MILLGKLGFENVTLERRRSRHGRLAGADFR
jgi:hypothetical protein